MASGPQEETQALFSRGVALHRQGQAPQAEAIYREVLRRHPDSAEARHLLGLLAYQTGRPEEAVSLISAAIAAKPLVAAMYVNRALALGALGRLDEALADDETAIGFNARMAEPHGHRGALLEALGRPDEAIASFDAAIALRPGDADVHYRRAGLLKAAGRTEDALEGYDQAVALAPDNADAWLDRGNVLKALGRLDEGLASYDRAVALRPDNAGAQFNRANALKQLGRVDEAIAAYDRAIALQPDFAIAHHNRAVCVLLDGDLKAGFAAYEWRKRCPDVEDARFGLRDPWSGEDIAGRTLFIFPELFLGDMIQFSRYARLAETRGATVILAAPAPLHALLRTLSPTLELIAKDATPPAFDRHCALMSLPRAFGTELATVPADIPYLAAEPERAARWKARLGERGFKVGVCWQGSTLAYSAQMQRSFPLAALADLAKVPGVRLISLQKHDGLAQLAALPAGMAVETLGEDFDAGPDAFLDTAAVMASCDLVISADTAVAHLAGALGVRTWVALPHVPDWRWRLQGDDSPWYPSLRLFRQDAAGDWDGVFARMAAALGEIAHA